MSNLVKNAIQATENEEGSTVDITLVRKDEVAFIEVKDNGVGIPEDKKPSIFKPNFTTKNSGTGLGLAISRKLIEQVNGKIYFVSEENVGTSFFVELPITA